MSKDSEMPMKTSLPVAAAEQPVENVKLGPRVLMSGFMTKKTRGISVWKQRWWQLKDDGILQYFKPDDPPQRLMGEIDVGKTCYEVKMGSDTRMKFPKAVPSCCCFSFSVLKRVFYVYTPTPDEARNWMSAISDVSRVINIKVFAGLERRKAPEIPGGNTEFRVTRMKVKGSTPELSGSCQDVSKVQYLPLEKRKLALASLRDLSASVPNSLDRIGDDDDDASARESGSSGNENVAVARKKNFMKSHDSLQSKLHTEMKGILDEPSVQLNHSHKAYSMEDLSSPPRSQKKPIPIPRKKGKDVKASEKCSKSHSSERDGEREGVTHSKLVKMMSLDSSLSEDKQQPVHKAQHKKNNSVQLPFSPPSSPPPAPPQETMPPPPVSSPPHTRPKLTSPTLLTDTLEKEQTKESAFFLFPSPREAELGPMSSPPRAREKSVILEHIETYESPSVIPKFHAPPPPSN